MLRLLQGDVHPLLAVSVPLRLLHCGDASLSGCALFPFPQLPEHRSHPSSTVPSAWKAAETLADWADLGATHLVQETLHPQGYEPVPISGEGVGTN